MKCRLCLLRYIVFATISVALTFGAQARDNTSADAQMPVTVFRDVRIFDGRSTELTAPTSVLVRGNVIAAIGDRVTSGEGARLVEGAGRTLMPGLIDAHVHMVFSALSKESLLAPELTAEFAQETAAIEAQKMLMRGFTSVRDVGGPIWSLKDGIDNGDYRGPRIWPSGPAISQTAGHGDMRLPHEGSRRFTGQASRFEKSGAGFIADGRAEVLTAVRENLRFGASQIKLMAGGGTSSEYDPLDVTQYTLDEMKAAVEAAEDWGTYVTVHAYHDRSVLRAIEAGVKCIEHGQLLTRDVLSLMVEHDIWLSTQVLRGDSPNMLPSRREKRKPVIEGQQQLWPLAKSLGVKLAWGTDFLFEPALNAEQNANILALKPWFTSAEILRLVTHDNAQLLAMSGPRSPYQGKLGVVEEGALADLILVDGNPIENIDLIANPERNFVAIMKDGVFYREPR